MTATPHADESTSEQLLTGWGRTSATRATVWTPARTEQIADRLRRAAHPGSRGVIARGLGRSYGDAAQNAGGTVILATGLDRVLELDVEKGTVTCEAGVSIDTLMRALIPLGWFPTVVPGTRYVTVGGAVASDIHGKYRLGSFCDAVTRLTLATPGSGMITVGPEEQPDVFWATAGGMGLTGVVTEATMRLQPLETSRMRVDTERATDVDDCMARMLSDDSRYRYSVAWIDCLASGAALGRSVLTRGNHARVDELGARDRQTASVFSPSMLVRAPRWIPNGLLNPLSIRAFNELWFRKSPRVERDAIQSMTQFFHPLDAVEGWNRIYGTHGFLQYQYVVPYGAEAVVRRTLERLSAARCASFLAVLKRFEHENLGPLSFPMRGWTVTLDIPAARSGLAELLDGLDDLVVEAGGRIYLSKDSRVRPELMAAMYPELDRWREARAAVDPEGVMRSDLSRRLGLVLEGSAA
jgi:decaprenylphospho-beta-D-ribofuranose 2-oxidase